MNLHYGCGLCMAEGWYDCDGSPTLWLQRLPLIGPILRLFLKPVFPRKVRYGNIVRGLHLGPNLCDAIYCSHVLEHLSLEDCRAALRNTFISLRPGGVFRLVVPDFEQQVATYLSEPEPGSLTRFLTYTHLGRITRPKGIGGVARELFGNSHHLLMWDHKGLAAELAEVGFRDIRRCEPADSLNPAFLDVERPDRFKWGTRDRVYQIASFFSGNYERI